MFVPCPSSRRQTDVASDVGDFPTRCEHCGAMLRLPAVEDGSTPEPRNIRFEASPARRAPRGELAGLLTGSPAPTDSAAGSLLRPETRRQIAVSRTRMHALQRAQLRGSFHAMGALALVGVSLVVAIAVIALSIRTRDPIGPTAQHADVLPMR